MNVLRIVLLAYVAIAVIVLGWMIVRTADQVSTLGVELMEEEHALEGARNEARRSERELVALETEQKDNRLNYSGPEAVEMSFKVQLALEANQKANAKRNLQETIVIARHDERRSTQLRMVPLIGLLLVHGIGIAFLIRPRRQPLMPR